MPSSNPLTRRDPVTGQSGFIMSHSPTCRGHKPLAHTNPPHTSHTCPHVKGIEIAFGVH